MKMISVSCAFCGDEVEMYVSEWEQREKTYCNDECRSKGMSERYSDGGAPQAGAQLTEEHKKKLSKAHTGKSLSEKTKRKMSKSTSGENAPWYGKNLPKDMRDSISETLIGKVEVSEKRRQELSREMSGKNNPMYGKSPDWNAQTVSETGHSVRSSWEKEVDIQLHNADVQYEYEPRGFPIKKGRAYIPDFIVESKVVIEVKGYVRDYCVEKAQKFNEKYNYEYVVIGSDLSVGTHFEYKDLNSAIDYVVKEVNT